jgi:hypothetical protein
VTTPTVPTVRAAVIGLGRMGSTYDDERGRFWRRQPPHAHAGCYRAADEMVETCRWAGRPLPLDFRANGERRPGPDGDLARHALEVAIALRESHRRGVRVDLPLADRSLSINSSETLAGDEPVAVRRARAAPIPGGRQSGLA